MGIPNQDAAKPTARRSSGRMADVLIQPSTLFRVALAIGAVSVWPYVAQKLPSLAKRAEYRLAFHQIRISPAPSGSVPDNLVDQVARFRDTPADLSILDEKLASDIARTFQRHPWVHKVVQVRKSYPAAVTVELEYRRPVAMVQYAGHRIPIDVDGVVLPGADFSAADATKYLLIQNVTSAPGTEPGMTWNDAGLLAAARLANLLGEHWKSLKLEAIFIPSNVALQTDVNDVPLELVTDGGSRVIWGRPPGNDHPGELEVSQKIRRLETYLADFGDYRQPSGPYEIDIRHWQEISRRPLKVEQAAKPAKAPKDEVKLRMSEGKKKARM